ncbi:peptide/nickel transport system permease protein [Cohaesibacter marisflavi]|uniref:Peptide/nickel transport system permease protein n=1 Tax=Cohaesibacter marisflavi TaxID=655353 RepID=A0A1I5IPP4_9HYPH|nr:ABC transporter permease [Cohaesibacter marisflavi]SFO62299.1 peptide/nickel transport system permease protein [Cohaesibacter marisflavi]
MIIYSLRRLASLCVTLVAASLFIFAVMEILPGDPAQLILGINAQEDTLAALREQLGLNLPLASRYWLWISGMLQGDFGISYTYSVPVTELISERLTISLPLALMALALSTLIALPLGILAASNHGRWPDVSLIGATQIGIAIPNFWFAMLLVLVFAVTLHWLPSGGFPGWEAGLWPAIKALLLPAIALALPQASILVRIMRSSMLEVLHEDYMRTARAKGLNLRQTLARHGLRNALIPVITIMGLQFSFLLAGTVIIENVFSLPGLGRLVFQAINQRDLITVKAVIMLLVATVILVNFLVDITYGLIDPRLHRRQGSQ